MKYINESIFQGRKLANKPKRWRSTLLLELIYGGWTLIRSAVITSFASGRDPEDGSLLNLLDNYLPLVPGIYSVVFKSNKYLEYFDSVFRAWIMFYCFKWRHYDKAPLIWLSNVLYWQRNRPDIFHTTRPNIILLDDYGIENVHSILWAQTKSYFSVEQLMQKAKAIFASKGEQHNFQSAFTPPKYYAFSSKQLNTLKLKAARILRTLIFKKAEFPGEGKCMIDENLLGMEKIPGQCLPLSFHTKFPPQAQVDKCCDLPGCSLFLGRK